MLGFYNPACGVSWLATSESKFGQFGSDFIMDDVACTGNEDNLRLIVLHFIVIVKLCVHFVSVCLKV